MKREEAYLAMVKGEHIINKNWCSNMYAFASVDVFGKLNFFFSVGGKAGSEICDCMKYEDGYDIVKKPKYNMWDGVVFLDGVRKINAVKNDCTYIRSGVIVEVKFVGGGIRYVVATQYNPDPDKVVGWGTTLVEESQVVSTFKMPQPELGKVFRTANKVSCGK